MVLQHNLFPNVLGDPIVIVCMYHFTNSSVSKPLTVIISRGHFHSLFVNETRIHLFLQPWFVLLLPAWGLASLSVDSNGCFVVVIRGRRAP